jgi:glycosyltransferase involved in cell wall biosynthesis
VRILIDYRPALRQRTGVGEYVHGLATALAARLPAEDSLTVFSSSWKDRLPRDAVKGARSVDRRLPVQLLNAAWHRLEWPPVEWLAGAADVVHSMHPLLMPSRMAARLVTIHDLYFLDRPDATSSEIRRDYATLTQDHARRADGIVVISEYTKGVVTARFGLDPQRVTVCYPGAPDWRPRAEPSSAGPILFVGTIEPRKNVPGLLRAYAELLARMPHAPDLVLAGRVPPDASLAQELAGRALAGRVRADGYVTDETRQQLYRGASMLVLPSFDEGFGITALEAMTLGVPVVAAHRGALPEVIGDAGLLVDPQDHGALADAMEHVLSDATTRRRMADAGVRRASGFTWEASATRLLEAYHAALTWRRSP